MRSTYGALLATLGMTLLLAGCGKPPSAQSLVRKHAGFQTIKVLGEAPVAYDSAVGTVDRFLSAWLDRDVAQASAALAPDQRHLLATKQSQLAFRGELGGVPVGFEVVGSREISPTAYQFDVWIYRYVPGAFGTTKLISRWTPSVVTVKDWGWRGWYVTTVPAAMLVPADK